METKGQKKNKTISCHTLVMSTLVLTLTALITLVPNHSIHAQYSDQMVLNLPEINKKYYKKASAERIRSIKKRNTSLYRERLKLTNKEPTSPTNNNASNLSHFTSGTGFFVDYHHIITNQHVVKDCSHIRIRGAVQPSYAKLLATDSENDLALLRTTRSPSKPAPIRGNIPLKNGEDVTVMGYPLNNGITGSYQIVDAKITDINDVYGSPKRIQFTDSVEKGNSGGPLMDKSGTVVGVIVGKMNFYLTGGSDGERSKPIKTSSIAISVQSLKSFLDKYHIIYTSNSLHYAYSKQYMEQKAKDYIVNIHCVQDEQNNGKPPQEADRIFPDPSISGLL